MTNRDDGPQDIREIRSMMEKPTSFLSLSGPAGIVAGLIATAGALAVNGVLGSGLSEHEMVQSIGLIGSGVLLATLIVSAWLSARRARRSGNAAWAPDAKSIVLELGTPLVAGGLFTLILVIHQMYLAVPGSLLIFYGIALAATAKVSREEVRFLGWIEIAIGMLAFAFPEHGLLYWALGFGIAHILYGGLVYFKYEM